jgi:hypothetical protein
VSNLASYLAGFLTAAGIALLAVVSALTVNDKDAAATMVRRGHLAQTDKKVPGPRRGRLNHPDRASQPVSGSGFQFCMTTQQTTWGTLFLGILQALVGGTFTCKLTTLYWLGPE